MIKKIIGRFLGKQDYKHKAGEAERKKLGKHKQNKIQNSREYTLRVSK